MKQTHKIVLLLALLLMALSPLAAQDFTLSQSTETDTGLSVSYFERWQLIDEADEYLLLQSDDGWEIGIEIGDYAVQNFQNTDTKQSAEDAINAFIEYHAAPQANYEISPFYITALGEGFYGGTKNTNGGLLQAATFNFLDGTVGVIYISHPDGLTALPATTEIEFALIMDSIRLENDETLAAQAALDAEADAYYEETEEASDDDYAPEGAIAFSSLAPGEIRLLEGITFNFPEQDWTIYKENDSFYSGHSIMLLKGDNLFSYTALLQLTLNETESFPIEIYTGSLLPMMAAMQTENEDFDIEEHTLTETLENGITIQYLNLEAVEKPAGNTYLITFDEDYWVLFSGTFTPQSVEDAQAMAQELHDIATSVHLVEVEKDDVERLEDVVMTHEGFELNVTRIDCYDGSPYYVSEEAPYALLHCPAGCIAQSGGTIWGTDIYTTDSNICMAAIHSGAITDQDGGFILMTWVEGQEEYTSTTQNGIESSSWGGWDASFTVEPFDVSAYLLDQE